MTDGEALFAAIQATPEEDTPRLVYADWLEENGRPNEAKTWRRRPSLDISVNDLPNDYDWKEVFGEGTGGNTDKGRIDACPPTDRKSVV